MRTQPTAQFSVGCYVLIDEGSQSGELAVENDDGSWDVVLDDGTDLDGVERSRLKLAPVQRDTRSKEALPSSSVELEAAAAKLRLGLTRGPDDRHGSPADRHMACIVEAHENRGALWLGDRQASKTLEWLRAQGVTAVVNVTDDVPNQHESEGIVYHALRCQDVEEAAELLDLGLDSALSALERWLASGRSVLVHCQAGRSRSSTVVLAHLMRRERLSLSDALERVSQRRAILPNRGFLGVLVRRQSEWCGGAHASPPPEYEVLARRFVAALQDAAVALNQAAIQQGAQRAGGKAGKSLAERMAQQEQQHALLSRCGAPTLTARAACGRRSARHAEHGARHEPYRAAPSTSRDRPPSCLSTWGEDRANVAAPNPLQQLLDPLRNSIKVLCCCPSAT